MATGDITSVTIRSDGFSADVVIEGFGTGYTPGPPSNIIYDYGLVGNNDPTNALVVFNVTSEGYNGAGELGTLVRPVYGMHTVRKPYPDGDELDEVVGGSDLTIRISLSEPIYDDDKNGGAGTSLVDPTVSFLAGWANHGVEGDTNAGTPTVTNSSTLDYAMVIANWSWPGNQRIEDAFKLRAVGFHASAADGKPIAAMEFTIDDLVNTPLTEVVAVPIVDATMNDLNAVIEYVAEFSLVDLQTLDDGSVTCQFKAYPRIGDENSVLDTSTSAYSFPDWKYRPQFNLLDLGDVYGKAVIIVDSVSGVDAGATASADFATADGKTPSKTIFNAVRKLSDYNDSTHSRIDATGSIIYLKAGTHETCGGDIFTPDSGSSLTWLEILPYPGESKSTITMIPSAASANRSMDCRRVKFSDVSWTRSSAIDWIRNTAGTASAIWLDDCTLNDSGQSGNVWKTGFDEVYMTNLTFISNTFGLGGSLARSNTVTGTANAGRVQVVLGNNMTCGVTSSSNLYTESSDPGDGVLGGIMAFNKMLDQRAEILSLGNSNNTAGVAIVQNVFERVSNSAIPAVFLYAVESGAETVLGIRNLIFFNNTIAGQRCNMSYNASGSSSLDFSNWTEKNNSYRYRAWKGDEFDPDGARVGNWSIWYGTGLSGNISENPPAAFQMDNNGIGCFGATDAVMDYVDDQSNDGGNTGGGDYHLESTSVAIGVTVDLLLPYDIEGTARFIDSPTNGGAAGAYEFESTVTAPNIVDLTILEADTALTDVGLISGTVTEAFDGVIILGNVISQNPAAATEVDPGSAVDYVVSKGSGSAGGGGGRRARYA